MRSRLRELWFAPGVILVLLCALATPAWAQNTSLAVIATDKTLNPLADLLTVELSKQAGVSLLERGEINRILGEQQLTTFGGSNCITLGKLLRADGVITLRHTRVQQQDLLTADLISVGLGFRLDSFADRRPAGNPDKWLTNVVNRFTPLLPKLGVQPRDAVPISLLNLRSAVATTEGKVLERSLSFLLADRLIHQPQMMLLERQHLGTLELEKDFMNGSTTPEWATARYVTDGEIIQGGPEPDKITIRMTIEPPQDKSPTVFTVSGSSQQLAQLVDKTVVKILAAIGRPTPESEWQPEEEAKRFYCEAISADRVGLDEEALAAGEASHALGCRSDELIGLLARQCCRKAFLGRGGLSDGYDRAQVDESTLDIGLVQRGLELANSRTNSPGLDVLLTAARVIRYYRETHGYNAHRQELETLRTTLRAMVKKITAQEKGMANLYICGFLASYAPYLYDDPDQVIACYRQVLQQKFPWPYLTVQALHYLTEARDTPRLFGIQSQRTPWLVSWRNESPETLNQIWEVLLKDLSASTNVNDRLDGLLLRLYSVDDDPARATIERQIRESLWNARQFIATDTFTYAIAMQLLYAMKGSDDAFQLKLLDFFLKEANFYDENIFERSVTRLTRRDSGFMNPQYLSALLKAMDEYGKRVKGRGDFQPAEFARYRQRLQEMAPDQDRPPSTRLLLLSRSWRPVFADQPGVSSSDFYIRKVIYRDSQVWTLGRRVNGSRTLNIFQVDPETLAETCLEVPLPAASGTINSMDMSCDLEVSPEYVFVASPGKVQRYDRAAHTWNSTEVPPSDFPAITILGGDLYYAFPGHMGIWGMAQPASGILRINPKTLEQEILASSRRKQSPTVLDDVPVYRVPSLFLNPGGALHAVVSFAPSRGGDNERMFRYDETAKDWTRVFTNEFKGIGARFGLLAFADAGGTWFQRLEVSSRNVKFAAASLHRDGSLEQLIAPSGSNTNSLQHPPWLAPDAPWDYSNPPSTPLIATRDGKDCWVLLKHLAASGDSLALYHYVPGREMPAVIPLAFAGSDANGTSHFPCLFATSAGLLIGGVGGAAFWIVPWSELAEFTLADNQPNASK